MWALTVALGLVIAYFILKFARIQINKTYLPGQSYYKSGPTVVPSPLPVDNALIGVGLETRVTSQAPPSVMDPGSPVSMVMMNPSPSPMVVMSPAPSPMVESGSPSPMMVMSPAPSPMVESGSPSPMMVMSPAPSPMSAAGNGPVAMTMVPPSV